MTFRNLEATVYALVWGLAFYALAQRVTAPEEPPAKPAVSAKPAAKQAAKGVRK